VGYGTSVAMPASGVRRPLVASAWVSKISGKIASPYAGIWPVFLLAVLLAVGWFAGGPLFRLAERSFWSLNSLVVEPCYAACREGLQHLLEQLIPARSTKAQRSKQGRRHKRQHGSRAHQ